MHKLPNLQKSRHGVWYFRHYEDGREVKLSLRTKDWQTAKMLACRIHLAREAAMPKKFDVIFPNGAQVRGINTMEDVERLQRLAESENIQYLLGLAKAKSQAATPSSERSEPTASAPSVIGKTKPFSKATELYLAEKELDNSTKTISEKRAAFVEFSRLFGDPDTNSISPEMSISHKNRLISDGLSALRINKTLSFFRDFFGYAINHKLFFGENPYSNLAISKKSKLSQQVKSYEPFTDDELKLIFETSEYATYLSKPAYYWLPILALFSGARIEELASLKLAAIQKTGEIWHFKIEKAKNKNSIRQVPIHPKIIDLGFLDYLETVKKSEMVFPDLTPGVNGFSKNASRRFGQYLEKVGIKNDRKVFHSFRSTFINWMTNLNTHPAILMGIVGHFEQGKLDFSSPHFQIYQKAKPIEVLQKAMVPLDYGLKFPHAKIRE